MEGVPIIYGMRIVCGVIRYLKAQQHTRVIYCDFIKKWSFVIVEEQ